MDATLKVVLSSLLLVLFIQSSYANTNHKCHLLLDAGSSGTRLYAFKKKGDSFKQLYKDTINIGVSWSLEQKLCSHKICTQKDIEETVYTLINSYLSKDNECKEGIETINLLATAGMRLAEQKHGRARVKNLYAHLERIILKALKTFHIPIDKNKVSARTITGAEEGIYTWLAVNILKENHTNTEGIIEMGGASMQIAYACENDLNCNDNSFKVKFRNSIVNLFSHSWLGLGRNEAYRIYNLEKSRSCTQSDSNNFILERCMSDISKIFTQYENKIYLKDHLNYKAATSVKQGTKIQVNIPADKRFHATGGFVYAEFDSLLRNAHEICNISKTDLIENRTQYQSIEKTPEELIESECFANLYYQALIDSIPNLNITSNLKKMKEINIDWIYGAINCIETNCLEFYEPNCKWNKNWNCIQ